MCGERGEGIYHLKPGFHITLTCLRLPAIVPGIVSVAAAGRVLPNGNQLPGKAWEPAGKTFPLIILPVSMPVTKVVYNERPLGALFSFL